MQSNCLDKATDKAAAILSAVDPIVIPPLIVYRKRYTVLMFVHLDSYFYDTFCRIHYSEVV